MKTPFKPLILIIDDSKDMCDLATILLSPKYEVETAETGKEALAFLGMIVPDLILLDLHLKDMSGIKLLEILTLKIPDIIAQCPIVFHSAATEIPNSCAIGWIRKPTGIDEFRAEVAQYVTKKPTPWMLGVL